MNKLCSSLQEDIMQRAQAANDMHLAVHLLHRDEGQADEIYNSNLLFKVQRNLLDPEWHVTVTPSAAGRPTMLARNKTTFREIANIFHQQNVKSVEQNYEELVDAYYQIIYSQGDAASVLSPQRHVDAYDVPEYLEGFTDTALIYTTRFDADGLEKVLHKIETLLATN